DRHAWRPPPRLAAIAFPLPAARLAPAAPPDGRRPPPALLPAPAPRRPHRSAPHRLPPWPEPPAPPLPGQPHRAPTSAPSRPFVSLLSPRVLSRSAPAARPARP